MGKTILNNLPIGNLSQIAQKESWRKEVYRPIYYIHKWWAKRLGSVFRGILLSCCLPETADLSQEYYNFHNFSDTTIFDPFMGSGVTIGEAAKLGCKVIGRDINPIAASIVESFLTEYDIREITTIYNQIRDKLEKRILSFYKTRIGNQDAMALYYYWVKYLNCPECGEQIDLFHKFIFSAHVAPKKNPTSRAICPKCENINVVEYEVTECRCDSCSNVYNPQAGNIKGAYVSCPYCNYRFKLVEQLKKLEFPLKHRMYAKIILRDNQKTYLPINDFDRQVYEQIKREYESIKDHLPNHQIMPGYNTNQAIKHNYKYWRQMFNERQLLGIYYLAKEIKKIASQKTKRLFACLFSGVLEFNNMFCSFKGEGSGAVRHMFSHHILKPEMTPFEANIWGTQKSSGSFSTLFKSRILRALEYKEFPFEINPNSRTNTKVYGINNTIGCEIAKDFKDFQKSQKKAYISCGDSGHTDLAEKSVNMVVTDPPFFDNVHYSELADFFHVSRQHT
ncbi:MAG: DNA methyltransferase [Planctomycetota bacterium]|jgi:adenine-specific DNA methylase